MVKAACGRCRQGTEGFRTHLVEWSTLNGIRQRKKVCQTCLREIEDVILGNGGEP